MSSISSIAATSPQSNTTDTATAGLGLPPVGLAQPASINTVNAELVASQFGIEPDAVSGVYGGSAASGSNPFSNLQLLPALANLSTSTAEQSLALLGVQTPTVGKGSAAGASPADGAGAPNSAGNAAIAPGDTVGAVVVDPLWGKNS